MAKYAVNAIAATLDELLKPREVGVPVVSHVLEDAGEPRPDFEAMRRALLKVGVPTPTRTNTHGESEQSVP